MEVRCRGRAEVPAGLRERLRVVEELVRLLLGRHAADEVVDAGLDRAAPVLVGLDRAVAVEVAGAVDETDAVLAGHDVGPVEAEGADRRRRRGARALDGGDVPAVGPAVRDVPRRGVAGAGDLGDLRVEVEEVAGGGEVVVGAADVEPDLVADGAAHRGPRQRGAAGVGDQGAVGRRGEGELAGGGRRAGRAGEHRRGDAAAVDAAEDLELPERVAVAGGARRPVEADVAAGRRQRDGLDAAAAGRGGVRRPPGHGVVRDLDAVAGGVRGLPVEDDARDGRRAAEVDLQPLVVAGQAAPAGDGAAVEGGGGGVGALRGRRAHLRELRDRRAARRVGVRGAGGAEDLELPEGVAVGGGAGGAEDADVPSAAGHGQRLRAAGAGRRRVDVGPGVRVGGDLDAEAGRVGGLPLEADAAEGGGGAEVDLDPLRVGEGAGPAGAGVAVHGRGGREGAALGGRRRRGPALREQRVGGDRRGCGEREAPGEQGEAGEGGGHDEPSRAHRRLP